MVPLAPIVRTWTGGFPTRNAFKNRTTSSFSRWPHRTRPPPCSKKMICNRTGVGYAATAARNEDSKSRRRRGSENWNAIYRSLRFVSGNGGPSQSGEKDSPVPRVRFTLDERIAQSPARPLPRIYVEKTINGLRIAISLDEAPAGEGRKGKRKKKGEEVIVLHRHPGRTRTPGSTPSPGTPWT